MIRKAILPLLAVVLLQTGPLRAESDGADSRLFTTTDKMREETEYVVWALERFHYRKQPIENIDGGQLIENFISFFDAHRLYFTQPEVDSYKERFGGNMVKFLERGDLFPAWRMFKDYQDRAVERLEFALKRLDGDFDFTQEASYRPDRTELPWPATQEEAQALWEKRIKFELINELLATPDAGDELAEIDSTESEETDTAPELESLQLEDPEVYAERLEEGKKNLRKRYERMLRYVSEIEKMQVQEVFLTELTNLYDPHSTFFSADSLEEFSIAMENALVGIGAILTDDEGYCTIRELIPGGPAERSHKLHAEDRIVGVAQGDKGEFEDVIGMPLRKIVKQIRGEKGTVVRLLIRPGDGDPSERREVRIIRDEVKLTANLASARVYQVPEGDRTVPIGVIDLPAFYGGSGGADMSSTTHDVEELLGTLKGMGVEGVVLDLRRNGGGLLSEAIDLAGLFIPEGPVVQVRDEQGNTKEQFDRNPKIVWHGPLVVLISRYSASASEIVAGALKNHGRALIVGDSSTHGKGTVQAIFEVRRRAFSFSQTKKPTHGAAKVTVQKYYLPDGSSTQIEGVPSDIVLPSYNEFLPIGEGDLDNAMIWDSIPAASWDFGSGFPKGSALVSPGIIESLREKSLARQSALEEFDFLNRNIEWFRERQEKEEFSLNLTERQKQREQDNLFQDQMEMEKDKLAEDRFPSEEVLLAVSLEKKEESEKNRIEDAKENGQELPEIAEPDEPDFDIHLREALRIMADWLEELEAPQQESIVVQKDAA